MLGKLEIIYKEKDNKSFFFIPKLGIISSGKNIQEARKNLEIEYENYIKKIEDAELQPPSNHLKNTELKELGIKTNYTTELTMFGIKYLLVVITIMIFLIIVSSQIQKQFSQLKDDLSLDDAISKIEEIPDKIISSINNLSPGESPLKKIEKELERAARKENQIPKEKQDKVIKEINIIVDRAKPFVDAFKRLFE